MVSGLGLDAATGGSGWSDTTVQPGTTYTYTVTGYDFHWNTLSTTFQVVTPIAPAGSPIPGRP